MGKINKICYVCNKSYKHCYSCPSDLQHPSWMEMFDTENCKNIFNILCKHGQKMISDEETRELLNDCDLSQKDTFAENIINHLNKVLSDNSVVNDDVVEQVVIEEIPEADHVEQNIHEKKETIVTNNSSKKHNNHKKNKR